MSTSTALATFADLDLLPEKAHAEVIDGRVVVSPRPLSPSGRAQSALGHFIAGPFDFDRDGPDGWWIVVETEVEFSAHQVFIPDLAGWRRTTLPQLPQTRPLRVRPDWVCELLSPSTERHDRIRKADVYLQAGVGFYWLLDVPERVLEAYESREGAWVRLGAFTDGDRVEIRPFDAITLDVGRLFPPPG